MPGVMIKPTEPDAFVSDDNIVYVIPAKGAGLRRDFDLDSGEVFPEGTVTLANCPIGALDEIWAIAPVVPNLKGDINALYDATVQENGAVDVRISVDNGVTWLYWAGAAWAPITGTEWTTFRDLNLNLATIPFGDERQIRFEVRLRRGTNIRRSPLLCAVDMGYSLIPDHLFEDPHRTLRRFFEDSSVLNLRVIEPLVNTSYVDLNHPLTLVSNPEAYNLTTDPTRQTDIGGLAIGPDNRVNFTAPQNIGDEVEMFLQMTYPVGLAHKDLDLNNEELAHVPQLLIQIIGSDTYTPGLMSEIPAQYTINIPEERFWRESPSVPIEYRVNVFALAADEILAIKILNSAYRTIKDRARLGTIRMVMSGVEGDPLDFSPPFASLTDTSEHLSVKAFTFILYVKEWFGVPVEGPLAQELQTVLDLMEA